MTTNTQLAEIAEAARTDLGDSAIWEAYNALSYAELERATWLLEALKATTSWAEEHYEKMGWDILVETTDHSDILEAIGNARTIKGAINNAWQKLVKHQFYARKDIQGHAADGHPSLQRGTSLAYAF